MTNDLSRTRRILVVSASLCVLALVACAASPDPRFYRLEAVEADSSSSASPEPVVVVGPVVVAGHLKQEGIVRRSEPYRVEVAELDRWAEPLEDNVSSALAQNLSMLIPSEQVVVYPGAPRGGADLSLRLHVVEFSRAPSGDVVLVAFWELVDRSGRSLARRRTRLVESQSGQQTIDTVAAMSRALEGLSREAANVVRGDARPD